MLTVFIFIKVLDFDSWPNYSRNAALNSSTSSKFSHIAKYTLNDILGVSSEYYLFEVEPDKATYTDLNYYVFLDYERAKSVIETGIYNENE